MSKPATSRLSTSPDEPPAIKSVAVFQRRLRRWYLANRRSLPWRRTRNPYLIWVSEVMLQQTQVATVVAYFNRFIRQFPDISALAAADPDEVMKAWEGLGYYSRARHLQQAARALVAAGDPRVPDVPEEFRQLPGVGDYINAAVQSIAFGHVLAVVDGNVKRVLSRIFLRPEPVNRPADHKTWQGLAASLLDSRDAGAWNQAMMELGALICQPRQPACRSCPVRLDCSAFRTRRQDEFPVRAAVKKVPHRRQVAGVVFKGKKILIVRRPERGLLAGLWEFPGGFLEATGSPLEVACRQAVLQSVGLTVETERHLARVRHAYTHFTLELDAFLCRFRSGRVRLNGPDEFRWISPADLSRYPLHKAVHKFLPALENMVSAPMNGSVIEK